MNDLKDTRIIVIDDKVENLAAAKEYFESTEYQVKYFGKVNDAKEAIQKTNIDDYFHFGFIDLEMEHEGVLLRAAGHYLSVFAFQNGVLNMIVSQKTKEGYHGRHYTYEQVVGSKYAGADPFEAARGSKSDPKTWKELNKTFQHHYGRTIFAITSAHITTDQNGTKPDWWESFIKDHYNSPFHSNNFLLADLIKEGVVPFKY